MKIDRKYLLASVLIILLTVATTLCGRLWPEMGDSWEHAASVNELSHNFINPSNPFLAAEGSTTPRFTLYILLLAILKQISNLSVIDFMELAGLCNVVLLLTGIYFFIKNFTRCNYQPFFTLVTLLVFWGRGWLYSSEYSLQFLTSSLCHPSIFALSISFWGWHFFLNAIKRKSHINSMMTVILSLLIFSAHPLNASFYFIFLFFLSFCEIENIKSGFFIIMVSFVLSILFSLAWPYFSIIEVFEKGSLSGGWYPTGNYLYTNIIAGAGLSLLGIPVAIYYLFQRRHRIIIFSFLVSSLIYITSYYADLPLLGRYIYFSIFFLQLLISFFLAELWGPHPKYISPPFIRNTLRITGIIILAGLSLYQIKLMDLTGLVKCCVRFSPALSVKRCDHPKEKYAFLTTHLKRGNVVLSDTFTSWIIPAMSGAKVISLFHDNPLVPDNVKRMRDTKIFFSPATDRLARMELVKRYGATHILIHKGLERFEYAYLLKEWGIYIPSFTPQLLAFLTSLGEIVYQDTTYILIML